MVPYFLSQHPLSSRGKSIPKVKGQPRGIPFVLPAVPCVFDSATAFLLLCESKQKKLASLIFQVDTCYSPEKLACCLLCLFSL